MFNFIFRINFVIFLLFCLTACTNIARFDQQAYQNAVNAKVTSLSLLDKAVEPYEQHKAEADILRITLEKGYEYAKGIPNNEITTQQWEIMKNPTRNLIGGTLLRWEQKKTLSTAFISAAKQIISDGFDTIIGLESGKIKSSEIQK